MKRMKCGLLVLIAGSVMLGGPVCRGDFESDLREAGAQVRPVMVEAESLLAEGRLEEGNARILAIFPEKSRTAVQAFMLGNILYTQNPKASYELHQRAAKELPEEANPQFEWAMEQHRAGEYAGAAASYAKYLETHPEFGPVYGLMAECLIRDGKIEESVAAWNQSEAARKGTLEQFETLVCEVNAHSYPHRDRSALLAKVRGGSIDDARRLIALDLQFPLDWWNHDTHIKFLTADLALLRKTKFADEKALREILCAGDCAVAKDAEGDVAEVLRKAGFLLDDKATLPQSGIMLSSMLQAAFSSKAIDRLDARAKWGQTVRDRALAAKDAEMFNVAANLYLKTDELEKIDRLGWETTGDERFAASLLAGRVSRGTLKLGDPDLTKAVKQFPENGVIAGIVVRLTVREGKPVQAALVSAIKAEYSHFSLQGLIARPGAATLRGYFAALAKDAAAK